MFCNITLPKSGQLFGILNLLKYLSVKVDGASLISFHQD